MSGVLGPLIPDTPDFKVVIGPRPAPVPGRVVALNELEEDGLRGDENDDRQYSLLDLAFGAVVVAAVLAFMMLWAVRTMGCRSC